MLKKILFPQKYIQCPGALNELPALVKTFGSQGLILASPTAHGKVLPKNQMNLEIKHHAIHQKNSPIVKHLTFYNCFRR